MKSMIFLSQHHLLSNGFHCARAQYVFSFRSILIARIILTLILCSINQVATKIMKQMIDQFTSFDLFGRDNYEYYARVTGRVLRVQDEWICSFSYPAPSRGKLLLLLRFFFFNPKSHCHNFDYHSNCHSTIIVGNGKNVASMPMRSMGTE